MAWLILFFASMMIPGGISGMVMAHEQEECCIVATFAGDEVMTQEGEECGTVVMAHE